MEILLPKLGFSMVEGSVAEWFVGDGGEVIAGAPLYSIENDKSVQEVEAPGSGTLRILSEIGEIYPVGTTLARIE